jgi:hypothetical protein
MLRQTLPRLDVALAAAGLPLRRPTFARSQCDGTAGAAHHSRPGAAPVWPGWRAARALPLASHRRGAGCAAPQARPPRAASHRTAPARAVPASRGCCLPLALTHPRFQPHPVPYTAHPASAPQKSTLDTHTS